MSYEWLTKGKRTVRLKTFVNGKMVVDRTAERMVCPPERGRGDGIHPYINTGLGRIRNVVPQPDGTYLIETHVKR